MKRIGRIKQELETLVVGQPEVIGAIIPYLQVYRSNLSAENRPVGVFLLLGPTGTGKTRTVEALAQVLHGSEKKLLKIDCGEYQMDHELSKLIGSPPGYLGYRDNKGLLTQEVLNSLSSDNCDLSLVVFDELEKAAPTVARLLLGVLDKGVMRMGDNSRVDWQKTLIFLTSNVGAVEMQQTLGGYGFTKVVPRENGNKHKNLCGIAVNAFRKRFLPEFVNRIDKTVVFKPLGEEAFFQILGLEIEKFKTRLRTRLGAHAFDLVVPVETCNFLVRAGFSATSGARELKRALDKYLIQPLCEQIAEEGIQPNSVVIARLRQDATLNFDVQKSSVKTKAAW
jgi:ATP-dependent Clp protease ATP-binding subunit ClpA